MLTNAYLDQLNHALGINPALPLSTNIKTTKPVILDDALSDDCSKILLNSALVKRRSYRQPANEHLLKIETINTVLSMAMKAHSFSNQQFHYPTPVAGGKRELRYILIARNLSGLSRGAWEYIAETHQLKNLSSDVPEILDPACEDWEKGSAVSLIFCINTETPVRSYINNLMHCCFEAGAISQAIQLLSVQHDFRTCIGGFIDKNKMSQLIGSLSITPLYSISIL